MVVCIRISDVRSRSPSTLLPSRSQMIRSSGSIIPLLTPVGVARILSAPNRTLIFPSFAATQPF